MKRGLMSKAKGSSDAIEVILSKCIAQGECLEWQMGRFSNTRGQKTYPSIKYNGKNWFGNRLILSLTTNLNPSDLHALHKCDNMRCLNPHHLYWGTQKQNGRDKADRKRDFNAQKTVCLYGHEYSPKNTYLNRNRRHCIRCNVLRTYAHIGKFNVEVSEWFKRYMEIYEQPKGKRMKLAFTSWQAFLKGLE